MLSSSDDVIPLLSTRSQAKRLEAKKRDRALIAEEQLWKWLCDVAGVHARSAHAVASAHLQMRVHDVNVVYRMCFPL